MLSVRMGDRSQSTLDIESEHSGQNQHDQVDRLAEHLAAEAEHARLQEEDAQQLREEQAHQPCVHLVDEGPLAPSTHTALIAVLLEGPPEPPVLVFVSEWAFNVPLVIQVLKALTEVSRAIFLTFLIERLLQMTDVPPPRLVELLHHERA